MWARAYASSGIEPGVVSMNSIRRRAIQLIQLEVNMSNLRKTISMSLLGGVMILQAVSVQAQLSGGSSAGGSGAMGQGGPDITRPGQGTEKPSGSSGSMNQNRTPGQTPSGPMDQGRPEPMTPGQGGGALQGKPPDTTGGSLGNNRPGAGTGSGSMGTPGGTGSGGGMGGSSGAGGGGK